MQPTQNTAPAQPGAVAPDKSTLAKINEAIAEDLARNDGDPRKFVTERGIILRLQKVPRTLQFKVQLKFPDPIPPMVYLEDREETVPNYADPAYNAAMQAIQMERALAAERVWFSRGATIVEMPDDVIPPESEEWLEGVEDILSDVPARGPARFAAWLAYYALPSEDEQARLIARIAQYSGMVLEVDVAAALDMFPGGEGGGADTEPSPQAPTEGGAEHSVQAASPNGGADIRDVGSSSVPQLQPPGVGSPPALGSS